MKDPADGLRAISDQSGEFRLVYDLRCADGYLSGGIPPTPTGALALSPTALPQNVLEDARTVLAEVGGIPGADYEQTVRRLQAWCNGFVVAPIRRSERRKNAFLTVALARKGCCRHRATTFVVLANAAGIPARLVTNEIHAFAEVMLPDGRWRALDFRLGEGRRGAWNFEPQLLGKYDVPKTVAVLLTCLMATVLIGISAVRHRRARQGPELAREDRSSRTRRRITRDLGREEDAVALLWLVDHARDRLAARFDVDFDDEESLNIALHREGIDDLVRSQAVHLIREAGDLDAAELSSLTRRRELYWCVKNVLRWLDGRRTIDRTAI